MSDPYDPYAVTDERSVPGGGIGYSSGYESSRQSMQPGPYEHTTFTKTYPSTDGGRDSARDALGRSSRTLASSGQLQRSLSPLSASLKDAQGASALQDDSQLMQGWLWKLYGEGPQAQWKRRWCVSSGAFFPSNPPVCYTSRL